MAQNIVNLGEREDRVLNIVKAMHGLKTKSEAIALVTQVYEENFLMLEVKPEYLKKLETIRKGKYKKYGSFEELEKSFN
ncbi:MAG: antitoxin [archaeon]